MTAQIRRRWYRHVLENRLFLWRDTALYALYCGQGLASAFHQHHAVEFGISFHEAFAMRASPKEPYQAVPWFLLKPDMPHEIDAAQREVLVVWVEAESDLARTLALSTVDNEAEDISQRHAQLAQLHAQALDTHTCEQATQLLAQALAMFLPAEQPVPPLHPQVESVLRTAQEQLALSPSLSPAQLAAAVYLSPRRLRQLFADRLGLPVQSYLLWQRLLTAIEMATRGASLTQAAHGSGFADAAHLTRTFRRIFGFMPSLILKNSRFIQVISCTSC